MKKINIHFYSYRPRLKVDLTWTTDVLPSVGDVLEIPAEFISKWDKKYFYEWSKNSSRDFKIKERRFILDKSRYAYDVADVEITLEWNDEEKIKVDKYLKKYK